MKTYSYSFLFIFLLYFIAADCFAQQDYKIDYMQRGYIYAGTAMEDEEALGGFGSSSNVPKPLTNAFAFQQSGFFLVIDTASKASFSSYNGYKFYIINNSDSLVKLDASDSRLSVIAQAYIDNKWQDIEYLPSSWCGNSYHTVYLKKRQYWEFTVPKYNGKIKTKLRYVLSLDNGKKLYSNEINAGINRKQLTEKEGHTPSGLMDPYNE
jgi:hypothetical protein